MAVVVTAVAAVAAEMEVATDEETAAATVTVMAKAVRAVTVTVLAKAVRAVTVTEWVTVPATAKALTVTAPMAPMAPMMAPTPVVNNRQKQAEDRQNQIRLLLKFN